MGVEITEKLLKELQNRLKVGSRRGVHLNAIPARSRYKFDLTRLSHINESLPADFIDSLLTEQPLKFKISWKDNVPDLNTLFEEDQAQLVKITKSFENLINQTAAIESEKGINTFGFGFPLLVRRDQMDKKLTVAPILIWSLRIQRSKEFNTWVVHRNEDDPIYFNEVLINHIENDSQIRIDQISEDYLDDGLIDKEELLDICESVIEKLNTSSSDDLRSILAEKLENVNAIRDKKYYEKLPLTSNNAFIEFGGLFSIFEVQKQNIIHDYEGMLNLAGSEIELEDMESHEFQPISSVETDPSQQGILNSLNHTRNILIQGPPGTGKSQSLTAILVNALENQRKTIVVCEKRTALEVLYNALIEKGLNYQCVLIKDIVKDRRVAVKSVRDRVDNSSYRRYRYTHSKETLDGIINKAGKLIESINKKHLKLDKKLLASKNWSHIVGEFLSESKKSEEDIDLDIDGVKFKYTYKELNEILELLREGQRLYSIYSPFKECSFLNPTKLSGDNPFVVEEELKENANDYRSIYAEALSLFDQYKSEYLSKRKGQIETQFQRLSNVVKEINHVLDENVSNLDFFLIKKTTSTWFRALSLVNSQKKKTIVDQAQVGNLLHKLANFSNDCSDFVAYSDDKSFDKNIIYVDIFRKQIETQFEAADLNIQDEFDRTDLLIDGLHIFPSDTLDQLRDKLMELKNKVALHNWVQEIPELQSSRNIIEWVAQFVKMYDMFTGHSEDLFSAEFNWVQYHAKLTNQHKIIVDSLSEKQNWSKVFIAYYLNSLLIKSANMDLPTHDKDYGELQSSLSKLEKEQLKYIKEVWYSKQIDATREFDHIHSNLAVENLYNKKSGTKHKRLSLRQIVKFDIDLFTTFFPIILTTPDVCSNLFKGNNKYFDIVMFDEASQLKLEDNLPALLKGKQIVVAGDEHQMPPSNYFSKIFDGSIEDEDEFEDEDVIKVSAEDDLLACESLLEFASQLKFDKKPLDFHYRSRHPYLIDFSNHAFYNRRLKPLPNSFDYKPIRMVKVDGTYSDHTNEAEAEMVLSIIENNINRLPDGKFPSVGVATFNIHQRNLILGKINERRKFEKYSEFSEKVIELEENGFFVKNLENIQGDERDVIILSTTYGYNAEGKFAQRFGSINHQKGYKLLNVIITRAKYKVYVCTSIPSDVYLNYKEHLVVEGQNNRRAVFFAYLAYAQSVSDNDYEQRISILTALTENTNKSKKVDILNADLESPFEEEVYHYLIDHVDEEKVIPQLQYAGFRIDLVYDSKLPGVPRIAIECDGATFHSSQEAYVHDLHRQKILESHGFVFHRIWSTNWWRNPTREIKKLVALIKKHEESKHKKFRDLSKIANAFTDEIDWVETQSSPVLDEEIIQKEEEFITNLNEPPEEIEFVEKVKVGSSVSVKYLNNGKDIQVLISHGPKAKQNSTRGVQEISVKSALAVSLIGKSVGDTVKVGNLDNYVEILEIIN
jgi:very-short-patch-repair endonuclease